MSGPYKEPIDRLTEFNSMNGIVPKSQAYFLERLFGSSAMDAAIGQATNFLTTTARQSGFQDPAARMYTRPDGQIGYIVFDAQEGKGALRKTDSLLPPGATPHQNVIFCPTSALS